MGKLLNEMGNCPFVSPLIAPLTPNNEQGERCNCTMMCQYLYFKYNHLFSMNRRKQQTNDIVDGETKKFKHASSSSVNEKYRNKQISTRFEDLPNEIIHEILDYFDTYQIYQSFYKLNTRFQNLLSHVGVSIKASILTFSKSTFHSYYHDFIRPLRSQLKLIDLSDPFIVEYIFPMAEDISIYSQLKTLTLKNIESQYLENLLHHLAVLPNLSSLTTYIGTAVDEVDIFNRLLHLPALKYCELSFQRDIIFTSLPISNNNISTPIEYLVLNNNYDTYAINALLSYIPQLRHLSIIDVEAEQVVLILLDNLKQCSFTLIHKNSSKILENLMKMYPYQIKFVHICKIHSSFIDNNDVDIWIDSIRSGLSPIKTVHLKPVKEITCDHAIEVYKTLLSRWNWSTLVLQQYFFTHKIISEENLHQIFRSFTSHR